MPVVEVLIPIQLFWELQDLLKKIEYLVSASEDLVVINDLQLRVYGKLSKYAVQEKDRIMLIARATGAVASDE